MRLTVAAGFEEEIALPGAILAALGLEDGDEVMVDIDIHGKLIVEKDDEYA